MRALLAKVESSYLTRKKFKIDCELTDMIIDTILALIGVILGAVALKVAISALRTANKQLSYQKRAYLYPIIKKQGLSVIIISNGGPGVARNIKIEYGTGNPVFAPVKQSLVCKELPPNHQFEQYINFDSFTKNEYRKCRIVWDDDYKKNHVRDFEF